MTTELLQIVTALPPVVSGVGDYALLLARELAERHGVETRFLSGNLVSRGGETDVDPFPAKILRERQTAVLLAAMEEAPSRTVLLHYVGYGYSQRGCPFWLVRALEQWKRRSCGKLIVLFHEVSGSGPVWTSGFWTSGLQAWLAKRLARLADARRVTTEAGAKRVRAMLPTAAADPVRTLAVFSTLGEPAAPVPHAQRERQMVVFGGGNWRREAYTRHLPDLVEACLRLRIERVIDIGSPVGLQPALPVPFVERGILSARAASDLMSQSTAGFFTYPVPHIGKSTIFAAYSAHGMTPVSFAANLGVGDENLRANEHFLAGMPATMGDAVAGAAATAAHAWYRQHRLAVHADEIHRQIEMLAPLP